MCEVQGQQLSGLSQVWEGGVLFFYVRENWTSPEMDVNLIITLHWLNSAKSSPCPETY